MKPTLSSAAILAAVLATGCEKPGNDLSQRLAELEKRANAAEERATTAEREAADARAAQQEVQRLLEEQKLAAERDAIERARLQLEERRMEMERLHDEQGEAAAEELRKQEEALAGREQAVEQLQSALADRQYALDQKSQELDERQQELAGREALPDAGGDTPADGMDVADVDVFYETLSPYGSWFTSPTYGYVWRPAAYRTSGWRPYTRGRWACTDRGWMWISDEPFGWATYHYGRWALCRNYGWIWVPGTVWAPSWVTWRHGGSYTGWAPLPPETLAYTGRSWNSSVEVTFGIGSTWFSFVETRYFGRPIHTYCLPHARNDHYWGNTVNITNIYVHNNRVVCGGPTYGDVARQTDRRPPFYRIEENRERQHPRDANHGRNQIRDGRVVVSRPRRDELRNPDDRINRPPRVSGNLERIDVDRKKPLDPEIVREFQDKQNRKNRPSTTPLDIAQREPQRQEETRQDRGDEQRRLNQRAEDAEKELRQHNDDRIRVLPRPADRGTGTTPDPKNPDITDNQASGRDEEQRRLNQHAEDTQKELRGNVDDRIRVLPRAADRGTNATQPPVTPRVQEPRPSDRGEEQRRLNQHAKDTQNELRGNVDDRIRVLPRPADRGKDSTPPPVSPRVQDNRTTEPRVQPPVSPRRDDGEAQRRQQEAAEESRRQQQRQIEEQQRRQQQAAEESRRQQQQRQAEEQQRQRNEEARAEQQRRQQEAVEESRRQQQRQAEEQQRRQQEAREESRRQQEQQQRQMEENQRRQSEESQRRNRRN